MQLRLLSLAFVLAFLIRPSSACLALQSEPGLWASSVLVIFSKVLSFQSGYPVTKNAKNFEVLLPGFTTLQTTAGGFYGIAFANIDPRITIQSLKVVAFKPRRDRKGTTAYALEASPTTSQSIEDLNSNDPNAIDKVWDGFFGPITSDVEAGDIVNIEIVYQIDEESIGIFDLEEWQQRLLNAGNILAIGAANADGSMIIEGECKLRFLDTNFAAAVLDNSWSRIKRSVIEPTTLSD